MWSTKRKVFDVRHEHTTVVWRAIASSAGGSRTVRRARQAYRRACVRPYERPSAPLSPGQRSVRRITDVRPQKVPPAL